MTKRQFMEELRSSLEGMVSQAVIQENMNYYEDYINEQIRNGKNEQDVLNELGSPRLIARSIIDAKGEDDDHVQTEYYEEEQDEGTPEDMFGGNTHIFTMNSTKFKLGCLLSVIIFIFITRRRACRVASPQPCLGNKRMEVVPMQQTEWVYCPVCGNKTRDRIREDTVLINYPLYCPKCKRKSLIQAKQLHIVVIKEPDA